MTTGRPRTLTPQLIDHIVAIIGPGVTRRDAALAAGIGVSTYHSWIARGHRERDRMAAHGTTDPDPDEAIFVEFLDRTEQAWANAKATALLAIRQAMHGRDATYSPDGRLLQPAERPDWRAAAWWLERSYPHEYGRRTIVVDAATAARQAEGDDHVTIEDRAEVLALAAEQFLAAEADRAKEADGG